MSATLLAVSGLSVHYGPIPAVSDVSLEVGPGEIVLLAGANGAGKTSVLRAVSGLVPAASGEVVFAGHRISGWPAHRIAGLGLAHVPEGRRVWPGLTVLEHLQVAGRRLGRARRERVEDLVVRLFPRLKERWRQPAGRLSGGEQQMLAIARGLGSEPRLLMLDELSLGLAPAVVRQLLEALLAVNREGLALLLVEQALHQALPLATRGYVLETGRVRVAGPPALLRDNELVRRAYLAV
jgi:branched-chain amino acid transport system ATP-binding protein